MIAVQDPLGQLPEPASTFAPDVDGLFYFCTWISLFFFVLIVGLLVYSAVKWRRRTADQPAASNVTHNTTLEVVWTLIPLVIVMVIFAWGWKGNIDQSVAPADALQFRVIAKKWSWEFFYPDSTQSSPDLYIPINTPIKIKMRSLDVLHSLYIPVFRQKRDVVPGVTQVVWFEATKLSPPEGFDLFCAEYCGRDHSLMRAKVHVISMTEWKEKPWETMPDDPMERGQWIWQTKGCFACHSLDGTKTLVAPTWQGIWGREERLTNGDVVTVDADYIRESIRNPTAKVVEGYLPNMPPAGPESIPDPLLDDLIEWMKTLK